MNQAVLLGHVFFGVVCVLTATWAFVEALQARESNAFRLRRASLVSAVAMWFSILLGGWWYVVFYKMDKALILKGPWPFAHHFVMETKEHLVLILLLLATYLPIVASNNLATNTAARKLFLGVAGMTAILALMMEGEGALIAMGVKVALLPK